MTWSVYAGEEWTSTDGEYRCFAQPTVGQSTLNVARIRLKTMEGVLQCSNPLIHASIRSHEPACTRLGRLEKNKETWLARGHGALSPTTEKDFFKEMKGEERLVCLFYRASPACEVMEKHLRILAAGHIETKFIMIEAEKAPFLAERLKIWMLPTLAIVKNEKTTDYIVGLDDMGGVEDFDTGVLEGRLIDAGVLFESQREGCRADGGGAVSQTNIRKGGTEGRRQFSSLGDGDEDSDFDDQ